MEQALKECCPNFHPEKWDEKSFVWEHKKFIKASVPTLFHIPLPPMIGKRVTKLMKLAEDSKKLSDDNEEILLLFNDPSAFKSELLLSVTGTVKNAENTTLSGTFMSKVFDGAFNAIPKFIKQMDTYLAHQHKKAINYFVHYAYCPKCAKKTGHNYMVLFAQLR
jgi:hypothetical protein